MLLLSLTLLALFASPALAQLGRLRGTIPGSLHQCEATSMFFFDSGASRPLSVLFLPSANVPASLRTGTTTLREALQYSPLLALSGIQTADANEFPFELQVATGDVFEVRVALLGGERLENAIDATRTRRCLPSSLMEAARLSPSRGRSRRRSLELPPASPTSPPREYALRTGGTG